MIPAGYESDESEYEYLMANLKITRLQHITNGAGLNGKDFDASLDPETNSFLESFRTSFNATNWRTPQPQLHHELKGVLLSSEEPLLLALKLFANCPDSANIKNKSFSFFVLDTTCKIFRQVTSVGEQCSDNTRMIAFNFIKSSGILSLNKAMIETYQIKRIRQLLLPKLSEMQEKGYYKEAAQWAMHLEITHEFDMLDLAFPLIAQERVALVEEYLDIDTHQRLPLVKFLDSLLHKDKSVIEMCEPTLDRYKNVNASGNILSYRPLSKLVARLAKKYKFDDTVIPNYKFTKTCSYLHYLYRDYQKGSMSIDSYRELVRENATTKDIQRDIVKYIAAIGDHNEAVMWFKLFQLGIEDCPWEIKQMIEIKSSEEQQSTDGGEDVDATGCGAMSNEEYLTFDLDINSIVIVDSKEQFALMLQRLTDVPAIYFDSEWKQTVCNKNMLCLLQIAVSDCVFLIDCLSNELDVEQWRELGAKVFNSINVLKIGFSLRQDLIILQDSLPMQLKLTTGGSQYLDLRSLWQHLKRLPNTISLPYGCIKRSGEALNDLTIVCLGKKLNKSNQRSNWANRPLRFDQMLYAALDARCLVLIYRVLTDALQQSGLKIDNIIDKISSEINSSGGSSTVKRSSTNSRNNSSN